MYTCFDFVLDSIHPNYRVEDRTDIVKIFRSAESMIVFRILHLIQEINYMNFIVQVIKTTIPSFLVVASLLFFVFLVYALFGMQLFKGEFDTTTAEGIEKNFDTFLSAFICVLKIAIFDDAYVFVMLGKERAGRLTSFLYVVSGDFFF